MFHIHITIVAIVATISTLHFIVVLVARNDAIRITARNDLLGVILQNKKLLPCYAMEYCT